jgi:uncharacterized protein DUF6894
MQRPNQFSRSSSSFLLLRSASNPTSSQSFLQMRTNGSRMMPYYYFDFEEAGGPIVDEDGTDLPNLDRAQEEAIRGLGDMIRDYKWHGSEAHIEIIVRDGSKRVLQLTADLRLRKSPSIEGQRTWITAKRAAHSDGNGSLVIPRSSLLKRSRCVEPTRARDRCRIVRSAIQAPDFDAMDQHQG